MKKLLSILLLFALFVSCVGGAYAEGFQLRSGIQFGDTMEDILQKETTLTRKSDDSNTFIGKIAGYEDTECYFDFDDDGKLTSMYYVFGPSICADKDLTNSVYKTLYQSLCRKYGDALGNSGGKIELIIGPAMHNMIATAALLISIDGYDADYIDYDEWIVDVDDYHVKIDLVSFYWRNDKYKYTYNVHLSYLAYTDEDYAKAVAEKISEREEVDNDL